MGRSEGYNCFFLLQSSQAVGVTTHGTDGGFLRDLSITGPTIGGSLPALFTL